MVTTECSGWPVSTTLFSISVAVGQACTQAPQETHSEPRKSVPPGDTALSKPRAEDGQREGALHLLAGPHAARADDALGGIEREIGVGQVLLGVEMVGALIAVAHLAQADRARHVLQLAIAVGGAGQAVERVVGDVELHHALAQLGEAIRLRAHDHAGLGRRGAGGGRALAALDLDEAEPARAEGLQHVGGAELGDLRAHHHGRRHHRGACGHRDRLAVDGRASPCGPRRGWECRSRVP